MPVNGDSRERHTGMELSRETHDSPFGRAEEQHVSAALGLCSQRRYTCMFEAQSWEPVCGKIRASTLLKSKGVRSRIPAPQLLIVNAGGQVLEVVEQIYFLVMFS